VETPQNPSQRLLTIFSLVFVFSLLWALWPFITNPTSVTDAYRSAGAFAPLVFVVLVAVAPTPGAIVGASAVAYFGQWQGLLLLYVGNLIAVLLIFALVRSLGKPAIERFLEPAKFAKADAFLARHPSILWIVYAFPIFPLEIITAVVALSNRSFRRFIIIPLLALPIDAFIVTTIGSVLSENFILYLEYASVAVVILLIYAILHFLYRWKRDEIHETGRKVAAGVVRVGKASVEVGRVAGTATVALGKATVKASMGFGRDPDKVAVVIAADAGRATERAVTNATRKTKKALTQQKKNKHNNE
jgi:uncharacterized membrane protein YdjX (TVP38/TMEM64 family)